MVSRVTNVGLRRVVIAVSAVVAAALLSGTAGYAIYQAQSSQVRSAQLRELRLVGDLKTDQILAWRRERLGDTAVGAAVAFARDDLASLVVDPGNAALRADLGARLEALRRGGEYTNALLASPDGGLLISLDPNLPRLDPAARGLVAQVVASQAPAMGDFVRDEPSGQVYIDVGAPILDPSGRPIAALLLRIDPEINLDPLVQTWPTESTSGETLLVRRDGEDVLFLNVLRHRADPPMTIRQPLSATQIPAVAAVLGRTGWFEGLDYRGVAVMADLRSIPGTSWFMVAKIDAAEINAVLGDRARTILLVGFLGVLLAGGTIWLGLALRQGNARHRRNVELEQRVVARTAELQRANEELTAVTYSVSHDLKAPLRAISGFAAALGRNYRSGLDEVGLHYVDRIVAAAEHMGILIEELLDYSRLGRASVRADPLVLGPLVTSLRLTFGERIAASGATLEVVEPLATPVGDPVLLERILANLIDNALTYCRPDVAPHVTLSAILRGPQVTLAVADNGVGIPAEYRERVFEVFTRLHTSEQHPGTGIGLSIVRKAARLMGSDVSLESVEGVGSTFSVVLPAASEQRSTEP